MDTGGGAAPHPGLALPRFPPCSQPILIRVRLGGAALVGYGGAALQVAPRLQVPQRQVAHHVLMGFPQELLEEPQAGQADLRHGGGGEGV